MVVMVVESQLVPAAPASLLAGSGLEPYVVNTYSPGYWHNYALMAPTAGGTVVLISVDQATADAIVADPACTVLAG